MARRKLVLAGGVGSRDAVALPERLHWRIRPAGLGLATELQADCCIPKPWRITLKPGWTGASVLLADGSSRWPASVLTGLGTPWNTVQPEGQLTLSTQGLHLDWISNRLLMTGNARLEATDLSSRLSTLKPMGSYPHHIGKHRPGRVADPAAGDAGRQPDAQRQRPIRRLQATLRRHGRRGAR